MGLLTLQNICHIHNPSPLLLVEEGWGHQHSTIKVGLVQELSCKTYHFHGISRTGLSFLFWLFKVPLWVQILLKLCVNTWINWVELVLVKMADFFINLVIFATCFITEGRSSIISILQPENIWKNKANQNVLAKHMSLPSHGQSLSISYFCYQGAHKTPITPQFKTVHPTANPYMANLVKTEEIYGF